MPKRNYGGQYIEIAIEIPSGKLAYGNDFRDQYPGCPDFYVNEMLGIKETVEWYGEQGLLHGFVGNSCPGIFKDGNTLRVANYAHDDDYIDVVEKSWGPEVGGICTDLWWYSLADYDDFVCKGGSPDIDTIDIVPGRYILKHDIKRVKYGEAHVYAILEKSDGPVNKWTMPEEGVAEKLHELIPQHLRGDDDFICVYSKYEVIDENKYTDDNHRFIGYKVWGSLGPKYFWSSKFSSSIFFKYIASEQELGNTQALMDKIVSIYEDKVKEHKKLFGDSQ